MECYCCGQSVSLARKAKLRVVRGYDVEQGGPDSAAYQSYVEEMTFRWTAICPGCFLTLDNTLERVMNLNYLFPGIYAPVRAAINPLERSRL
jgi:hypothetical protein